MCTTPVWLNLVSKFSQVTVQTWDFDSGIGTLRFQKWKNKKEKWECWCLKLDISSTRMVPECSWWPIAAIHQPYTSAIFHNSTKLAIPRKCQHTRTQCTQQRKMPRLRMIHETLRSKICTEFCFYLSQVLRKSVRDYNCLIANSFHYSDWMRCHSRITRRTLRYGDPFSRFHWSYISACPVGILVFYWYFL